MKLVSEKTGLILRLGVLVTAMLFGQQAMAVGTRAATAVDNTALVDYEVAGVAQTQLNASANFVVDRRVDFTLVPTGAALAPITPNGPPVGDPDYFVEFLLTNTSNSVLDFNVDLAQLLTGDPVRASFDGVDMATVDFAVAADPVGGASEVPVRATGNAWVDELDADEAIRIRVYGDVALVMLNDQVAGVDLTVNGAEPGAVGVEGAPLNDTDPPTDLGVENVFDNPSVATTPNFESSQDGFIVVSADLAVAKAWLIVNDPLGAGLPIPGVTIEYTITIVNSSLVTAADLVQITDAVDTDLDLLFGQYAGSDFEIDNGGAVSQCTALADADDCDFTAGTINVGAGGTISVAASTTLTFTFQVEIPDPALTP